MKTLDEVIKANECCDHGEPDSRCEDCPYNGIGACCAERESDALHYLKEYRDRKETLRNWTEKAISEQQNLSDAITFMRSYRDDKDDLTALRAYWKEQHENDALTWDELLVSIGKPVWVESVIGSGWYLTGGRREDGYMGFIDAKGGVALGRMEDLGKTWQAYRKERG